MGYGMLEVRSKAEIDKIQGRLSRATHHFVNLRAVVLLYVAENTNIV